MAKTSKFRAYLAAMIVNITTLSLGVSIGWMSPTAPALQSDTPPFGTEPLSDQIISWLGSLQYAGGVAGVLFWGQITEKFGRKPAGYLLCIPLLIGWSSVLFAQNHVWLIVGRFIMGFSVIGALIIVPSYVSEISEDSYRGSLGSFIILFFNLGVVLAYFVGSILSVRNLTIFCASIPIVFLCFFYFLPESPVYLWSKGKKSKAQESLLWFRSGNNVLVEQELEILNSVMKSDKSVASIPVSRLYDKKGTIKAMINSLQLFTVQQFCGILMLLTYSSIIINKSEINFSFHTAAVIIGLVQLIASWITSLIIDRFNRRTLLILSNIGMSVTLFTIGLFFYSQKYYYETNFLPNWVPFICMCIHVIFYCLSAPMGYIITCETLVPEIRPLAFSVIVFWGTSMSFLSIKIYVFLVDNFYMQGNFWFFSLWCIFAVIYTIFFIPETRGKSLVEVLKTLNGEQNTKINKTYEYEACSSVIPIGDK
ncbi:facilitated trehalose transporter Tret1-like [Lycorma delicatula]|uniref:facilitated trehalose transporter Tret1-like n=1 Tax=Lycorma delicatula TaxID=130591 RepID=UPI003F514B4E